MASRPYTILSSAVSLDGYLDDTTSSRLILSHPADFDQVDALRASCDAILVGANTIRKDDPSLSIRSPERRLLRRQQAQPEELIKVTLTRSGRLSPSYRFFQKRTNRIYVYCTDAVYPELNQNLGLYASVIPMGGDDIPLAALLNDLLNRGVQRLLIEGGQHIATHFLAGNLIDELRLAVAPFFVGEADAPRFVGPGRFPFDRNRRMQLIATEKFGDMAVLTYKLEP